MFTNDCNRLQTDISTYHNLIFKIPSQVRGMEIREQLSVGSTFHICTRTNNNENLFIDDRDYNYFKRKMEERLTEAWDLLGYVLLPQEIHLVVKIKRKTIEREIVNHPNLLGHLLNGYVQHFNYRHLRTGSLLNRSFRRKKLETGKEIKETICLMHNLPLAKKLVSRKEEWSHSSFEKIKTAGLGITAWAQALAMFGSAQVYELLHESESLMQESILIAKTWVRLFTPFELDFMNRDPLGGHRWSRRKVRPPE